MTVKIHPDFRSIRTTFNGAAAWEKHASVKLRLPSRIVFSVAATVTGADILRSTHNPDAIGALAHEAKRLKQMKERGYRVPDILEEHPQKLILSDIGPNISSVVEDASGSGRRAILVQTADYLAGVHARLDYHGRSLAKDLTLQDGRIGMIDFEHNPLAVMSLAEAQARDIWFLLTSASRYAVDDPVLFPAMLDAYRSRAPAGAVEALRQSLLTVTPYVPAMKALSLAMPREGYTASAFRTNALLTARNNDLVNRLAAGQPAIQPKV